MRYLLITEAAELARTSPSTIRWWIQTGKLRSTRPGRRRLILMEDLIRLLDKDGEKEASRRNLIKPIKRTNRKETRNDGRR